MFRGAFKKKSKKRRLEAILDIGEIDYLILKVI